MIKCWWHDHGSSAQPAAGALGTRSHTDVRSSRRSSSDGAARCGEGLPPWSCTQALPGLSRVYTQYCSPPPVQPSDTRPSPSGGRPPNVRQTVECRSSGAYSVEPSATTPTCPRFTENTNRPESATYSRSPKNPSVPHVNMSFNSYTSTKVDGFQVGFSARQLIFMIWLTLAVDHHAA